MMAISPMSAFAIRRANHDGVQVLSMSGHLGNDEVIRLE